MSSVTASGYFQLSASIHPPKSSLGSNVSVSEGSWVAHGSESGDGHAGAPGFGAHGDSVGDVHPCASWSHIRKPPLYDGRISSEINTTPQSNRHPNALSVLLGTSLAQLRDINVCAFMQVPNMAHIAIQKSLQPTGNMLTPMWFQIAGVALNFAQPGAGVWAWAASTKAAPLSPKC